MALELVGGAVLGTAAAVVAWRRRNPACPSCGRRRWDRKLCRPLLLCRHCAQRVDRAGRRV